MPAKYAKKREKRINLLIFYNFSRPFAYFAGKKNKSFVTGDLG